MIFIPSIVLLRMPMHFLAGLFVLACAVMFSPGPALGFSENEQVWSYKDWHAQFSKDRCTLSTGGDGSGRFVLSFDMGGFNTQAAYRPIVYSNYPLPLRQNDKFEIYIDQIQSVFGAEMWFFDGPDPYGRYMVGAGLTGGFVPSLVDRFRRGNAISIIVRPYGRAAFVSDSFSLSGFTATYLKAAEWCRFNPNNLFRS